MIHGHPPQPPQQQPHPHMGHPPPPGPATHQIPPPPPHLTHLTSVPPPNVPPQQQQPPLPPPPQQGREHPGPRINNRQHHHPRVPAGGDHHQSSMPGGPHMPLQSSRKPPSQHYGAANGMGPGSGMGSKHQHPGGMGGHPSKALPYGSSSSSSNSSHQHHHQQPHHHQQQQQHNHHSHHHSGHHNPAAIPVVSAAGPGASKARMIPSHEPKNIHNHSNTAPIGNTANAIVVHQADPVQQLSGGISSSTATTTVGSTIATHGSTSNTTNSSATNSGSLPPMVTGGSGGGGGGVGTTAMAATNATVVVLGSSSDSAILKDSSTTVQSQSLLLSSVPETLANTKEKTPMCLVNELARYNKIQHQYRLTCESGPAHKKRFTVTLKLGDEEYTAEGPSIKKAQHSAAHEAIGATKYKHPPAKTNRAKAGGKTNIGNITPTVELNALAMKRGEPTVYETEQVVAAPKYTVNSHPPGAPNAPPQGGGGGHNFFSAPPPHYGGYNRSNSMYNAPPPGSVRYGAPPPSSFNRRNTMGGKPDYHSRGYYYNQHVPPMAPPIPEVYKVTLHVGERTFLGEGHTLQAARHDAAARALEVLKPLTPDTANPVSDSHNTSIDSDDPNSDLKSPISLVHEMALKRKLTVQFEVHGEKGPPHMKVFTTLCKVGSIVTEGEGNGKKLSKKRAAEKMLDELRKLPPASPEKNTRMLLKQKRKVPLPKKKTRNLIKEKGDEDPTGMVNPISRLMQIQQARKEKEPVYTLVEERGVARRREFIMEVSASGKSATGIGPTKKLAKKEAAENLLVMLGYGRSVAGAGSPNKENMSGSANEVVVMEKPPARKIVFNESGGEQRGKAQQHGAAGRQIVPGVLQLNSGIANKSATGTPPKEHPQESNVSIDSGNASSNATISPTAVNSSSTSNVAPSTAQTPAPAPTTLKSSSIADVGPMKKQLMYLAQLLKFEVMFSDFPKGNHGEYLTLVTLSTEPPQLCHGSGASLEESHDEAARGALEILSKIGLDNVKPKGSSSGGNADESKSKPPLSNGLKN
ncbi:double-stranded RNA-binding protein Staufen homolog 2 [Aedes aegypti]|uniref:DRBM domain-containing protein n=2 Tax=Aedes aegypti TaxID=7159 RepID=A0A6I8TL34_AEDAE|nr:double-stranded RNA-binding protein Staufen homolog 2 [Aedes aegypti]XP_021696608.1 double-stranded RNA-binding protein Staufen homolog 2 [Aedes aegypti]